MPRRSKTDQDMHWMRSFWDEVRTMNVDHEVLTMLYVHPSKRPGVFVFRMVATTPGDDDGEGTGYHSVQFEYPSASLQSLPSTLFAFSMKLSKMVDEGATEKKPRHKRGG